MDEFQAELLGMHAGDGTLYRTNSNSLVWELRGGHDEHEYYSNVVVPLVTKVFNLVLVPHSRTGGGNGSYGVRCCNRKLTIFISSYFPVGSKSRIIQIPQEIMNASLVIQAAFMRGLCDTDGCIYFDKSTFRPRIEIGTVSPMLCDNMVVVFERLGLPVKKWVSNDLQKVGIGGWERVLYWLSIVGFHNPKHLNKVERALAMREKHLSYRNS